MRRKKIADWSAGILAVAILVFGGLVVVKPAVDHWNELYRENPFSTGTKVQTIVTERAGRPTERQTTTTGSSATFTERVLGNSGLLFVRLAIVALAALLAAAVLQRAVLGSYGLRAAPAASRPGPEPVPEPEPEPLIDEEPLTAPELPTVTAARNGVPDQSGANLAPAIAKLVYSRREELGLSQRELAKRAGLSHTVISRIESGEHSPSRKTLERLADVLA